ncbi:cuticle protein 12.5-like [Schistocerca americana]|uniref:cuticle protein 12.5-like n=1 Tax=Schistocerca americana TaxID=7009 RepID=UPI001F4FE41F|nr:cuticle protein 12.5-like [Schistocerca americana]
MLLIILSHSLIKYKREQNVDLLVCELQAPFHRSRSKIFCLSSQLILSALVAAASAGYLGGYAAPAYAAPVAAYAAPVAAVAHAPVAVAHAAPAVAVAHAPVASSVANTYRISQTARLAYAAPAVAHAPVAYAAPAVAHAPVAYAAPAYGYARYAAAAPALGYGYGAYGYAAPALGYGHALVH